MKEFEGRTAFITGGASGMAFCSAQELTKQGANVALIDVNEEGLKAAAAKVIETFGAIDILLNFAGGMSGRCCNNYASFEKLPIEVIDWGLDVNLRGAIYCCRAIIGGMMERKRGVIINFGSVTGEEGGNGCAIDYGAEKSAMHGLTKGLARLGAPHGVRACCVMPGPVLTRPGMAKMHTLIGRAAEPIELVNFVLYLCSDKASFITGSSHLVDGGHLLV